MTIKDILKVGYGFWVNEDNFSDWYEDISECPCADAEIIYITANASGELVVEI